MSFADDGSTFASKPFTFIVESKPLYIHAALVAAHSEPLNRMINGHLSEARQGFAVLDDVDEGTFLRFVRWTYSNDYPAQEHRSVDPFEDPAPTKDTTTAGPNTRISSSGRIVKKKKKKTKPAVMGYLRESFIYSQLDVEPFSYIVPAARAKTASPSEASASARYPHPLHRTSLRNYVIVEICLRQYVRHFEPYLPSLCAFEIWNIIILFAQDVCHGNTLCMILCRLAHGNCYP